MQAAVIDKPGSAVCRQVPDPVPAPGECLLSPLVGGICGTDVHIFQGEFIGRYPIIPCHELAARVIESGDAASGLKAGDLVAVDPNIRCGCCPACRRGEVNLCENYQAIGVTRSGGFAGLVCVPAANLHRIYSDDQTAAAFAEPLACVLYGLSRLTWQPGMRVMIWGAGAIGLLHLQVCKRLRGASVTVVDMDALRMHAAVRLGADHGMLFTGDGSDVQAHAPWDIVIDATGSAAAVNAMFKHLRRGGQALVFGVYPAAARLAIAPMQIFLNNWKIVGSCTYRHEFAAAAQLISTAAIETQALISKRISLAEVPETLQHMAAGERMGKVQVVL
jgi:threonine dehydrogenase-like Zn-dependent dehydrogenase